MKFFAYASLITFLATGAVRAQNRSNVHTAPTVPSREALDRLNLTLAWSTSVPTENRRDGLTSVQVAGKLLLVQTRSGQVSAIESETGRIRWSTRVGKAYQPQLPLAFNRKGIYVINGTTLYGLDRENGALQWQFVLPGGVSAPPYAGDYQIYIGYGTSRLTAYLLPNLDRTNEEKLSNEMAQYIRNEEEPAGYGKGTVETKPILAWEAVTRERLEWMPVSGRTSILYATPEGQVVSMDKFPAEGRRSAKEQFHFQLTDGPILAAPGGYENIAYIGGKDSNLYALQVDTGRTLWRFTTGMPISSQPIATDKDVYVVTEKLGLARVDRATGEATWRLPRGGISFPANVEAIRFIASNPKFVYASDAAGRLLVLDRATGVRLSAFDGARDFTFPITNDVTDRIYLGSNSGLLVCLHDRGYSTPYFQTKSFERSADPRVIEVKTKLAKPITDPGTEPRKLGSILKTLLEEKNGKLKYRISEKAFQEAGVNGNIEDRLVTMPKVNEKPLGEVLKLVLAQVDANYQVIEDTILIYPIIKKPAIP